MSLYPIKVREESKELYNYIMEGIEASEKVPYPAKMTSPYSKAKYFKKHNPQYHKIPNSILRGNFRFGKPKSDGMMGLRLKPGRLHVWGLGEIYLNSDGPSPSTGRIVQIILNPDYEIVFRGMGLIGRGEPIVLRDYSSKPLNVLEKEDPIFRYLKVNQVFTEYGWKKMCLIRDVIEHLQKNPNLTRKQIEKLGIRGDKLWDLIVNYQPALDSWIRAGSKPREGDYKRGHYILSRGQHEKRVKREWSLSEHLSPSDIDAGKLKQQSFDAQTYEALRSDKWGFFS